MMGVLFDFNGTMLFDSDLHELAWGRFFEERIGRRLTEAELHREVLGRNAEWFLPRMLGRELEPREVRALEEEKEAVYRQMLLDRPERFALAPGLEAFLERLRAAGVLMNIATASALPNVRFFFEHLGLSRWFDFDRVVFNDGRILGKPAPDYYLRAAERIGLEASECAVFEDSPSGLRAAVSSGSPLVVGIASMVSPAALSEIEGVSAIWRDFRDPDEELVRRILEE